MHWQQYIDRYLINRILENSDFAKKLEDYQLTDFLQYIKQRRGVIGADLNSLILAHPDRTFTLAFFPEYSELDVLEGIIKAEISRRSHPQPQKPGRQKQTGKESQRCYALYYHYLQKAGLYPDFTDNGMTKTESIGALTKALNVSPVRFETIYNKVSRDPRERTDPKYIKDLHRAIELLAENPDFENAKSIAEDELTIANSKKR